MLESGCLPRITVLEELALPDLLNEREEHWISKLRKEGAALFNIFDRGTQRNGYKLSPAHREKIRKSLLGNKRFKPTQEICAKISETKKGVTSSRRYYTHTDETRKKISAAKIGMSNGWKGRRHSEETKLKMQLAQKRRYQKQVEEKFG